MQKQQFQSLVKQGYNYIPVTREILADLDTPLSAYMKLANGPYSYLFESVQGGEKWGRYSILGLPSRTIIKINASTIQMEEDGVVVDQFEHDDPLSWIEEYRKKFRIPQLENLPRFTGGLVGYYSYDTVAYVEPRLAKDQKPNDLDTPDILLMVSFDVLVFDNLKGKLLLLTHADASQKDALDQAESHLGKLEEGLQAALPGYQVDHKISKVEEKDFVSGFSQEKFLAAVKKIKQYIIDGDVMQVVLSQRMSVPMQAPPIQLYRALRSLNPSPYMYFLDLKDFHVVGSSPEILVRVEEGIVTVRPIAGTRPRGKDDVEDKALEEELLADPKERAEHLMLIDLGRNDVGRVAQTGSVQVTDQMVIERYSHVMHIVSNTIGKLNKNCSLMDVLRATFPAGTVSGAPKIRAMEIINELEPVRRGVYAGAVGYISWSGNMDTAIAIRTAVIKDERLYIQAGAGIVADSKPQMEWEETMNKGRAIFKAVEMAESGFGMEHR